MNWILNFLRKKERKHRTPYIKFCECDTLNLVKVRVRSNIIYKQIYIKRNQK